jgi:hypothetical protein
MTVDRCVLLGFAGQLTDQISSSLSPSSPNVGIFITVLL